VAIAAAARGLGLALDVGYVGWTLTQRGCQIELMFLLLNQEFADRLGHGEFAQGFALTHPIAIVTNRFVLILKIEPEHVLRIFRLLHWLGRHDRRKSDAKRGALSVLQIVSNELG
jgi:hypothetical protein